MPWLLAQFITFIMCGLNWNTTHQQRLKDIFLHFIGFKELQKIVQKYLLEQFWANREQIHKICLSTEPDVAIILKNFARKKFSVSILFSPLKTKARIFQ